MVAPFRGRVEKVSAKEIEIFMPGSFWVVEDTIVKRDNLFTLQIPEETLSNY